MSGKWQITYEAPVGTRILKSRFIGITQFSDETPWWDYASRKWVSYDKINWNYGASNTAPCDSVKAFERHLRRHPELRSCRHVRLVSRFVGHNVTAKWIEE